MLERSGSSRGSVDTSVSDIDVDARSSRRIVGEDEIRLAAGEGG